jgi:hypothetical protein
MAVIAILALEQRGRRIPIASTREIGTVRAVARAALAEVRAAQAAESDVTLAALTGQEATRLEQALVTIGVPA